MVSQLRKKCDVVIGLMHMGLDKNSQFTSDRIAREVDGIDLIIDGHSHTKLPEGLGVGNTLIAQTGWHGQNLGRVQIDIDNHKITSKSAQLLNPEDVKKIAPTPDPAVQKTLMEIEQRNSKLFNEVIAQNDKKLSSNRSIVRRQESELGNLCADAFKWRTGADIAIMNGGGLRTDLPAGDVKLGDVMELFPFGNTIQMANIDGKTIHEMLEHSVSKYPVSFGGFLDVSGMTFEFDPTESVGQRIKNIQINGMPIEDSKQYTMASIDFMLVGGDDYNMLKDLRIIGEFGTCEEILTEYLNKVGIGNISVGRIKILNPISLSNEAIDGDVIEKEAA